MYRTSSPSLFLLGLTLLLIGAIAAASANPAPAQEDLWEPSQNLSLTESRSYHPLMQSDPQSGDIWVLWTEETGDPLQAEIQGRRWIAETETWTRTTNLSNSPDRDGGTALHMEQDGTLHLFWSRRSTLANSTELMYRYWDGSTWSNETSIDYSPAYHPSPYHLVTLRNADNQLCLFVTEGSGVSHTCLQGESWEPLAPWKYIKGMQSLGDIVLGPDGRFHVAALGQNEYDLVGPCDPWLQDAYYTTTDGENWDPLVNLSYYGSIAYDVQLIFDAEDQLHFVWSDIHSYCSLDSERSAIYERVLRDGSWGERTQVSLYNNDQAMVDFALQIDDLGRLHLAWSEGLFNAEGQAEELSIRYARWAHSVWRKEEVVHTSPEYSLSVNVALNQQREPLLVWEEGVTLKEEIYYSQRVPERYILFLPLIVQTN